jgi:hypothetical protein
MPPIPLDSLRILNKKFGWQKSCEEISQDDMDDIDLYQSELKQADQRFFNSESETWGSLDGSSEAVVLFWYRFFSLVMRLHVKTAYIEIGTHNRGIPLDFYKQHMDGTFSLIAALESLTLSSSLGHLNFYCFHLSDHRQEIGNQEFFEYVFEKQYVSLVEIAHSSAKEQLPFFSDKNVDPNKLIVDLRKRWKTFFEESLD